MTDRTRSWLGVAIVLGIGIATVSLDSENPDPSLEAARSWAVQAQLKAIDQNRARFVDDLLREWANYVDPYMYDLQGELRPIAMTVPAWQLYGASLVGDFPTFLRVLTGQEGAGRHINALEGRQQKAAYAPLLTTGEVGVQDLGSPTDSLVFTPIAPCRVVDTRFTGARTGILAAGAWRNFDLTTGGLSAGQGGAASCPGLPSFSHAAWAVNITVTGYSGAGWLVAWPFGGTEPTASVVNYGAAIYAIANGQSVTGCYGCTDDITVRAYGAATHVIIDVVGYYHQGPSPGPSAVTKVAGASLSFGSGGRYLVYGGVCPNGTVLVGGELSHEGSDIAIGQSYTFSGTLWRFWLINTDAVSRYVYPYSRCMDAPVKVW